MTENKVKQYYTIKVDGSSPVEVTYRILADDEYEAMEIFKKGNISPSHVKHKINSMKKTKVRVYKYGMTTLMMTRTL